MVAVTTGSINLENVAKPGFPEFPSLSPDGRWVVFAWAGDLWLVGTTGGFASRLTAHPADERRSAFSPDGRLLAFESDRHGSRNLYVAEIVGWPAGQGLVLGEVHRATWHTSPDGLGGFSADGKKLLFATDRTPTIFRSSNLCEVPVFGADDSVGTDLPVEPLTDAFGQFPRAMQAAGCAGESVLFVRDRAGLERPKYRGSGAQEVYRLIESDGATRVDRVTHFDGNDSEPFGLSDGSVVFISSRDGQNNVWKLPAGASDGAGRSGAVQLTRFAPTDEQGTIAHGVRDLAVSYDGRTAVFAVWDRLYRLDLTATGAQPEPIDIVLPADTTQLDIDRRSADKDVSEAVLSPDGKTLALIARGEVYVRSVQEGFPTRRVTQTVGRERDLVWSPDGQWLYFTSDEPLSVGDAAQQSWGRSDIWRAGVSLSRAELKPASKKPDEPAEEDETEPGKAETDKPEADQKEPSPSPATGPQQEPTAEQPASEAPAEANDSDSDEEKESKKDEKPKKIDHGKRWAESLRFTAEALTTARDDARMPLPSPDGKTLLYTRGLGDVVLRDLETGSDRTVLESWAEPDVQWAADSRHIVMALIDLDFNSDIWVLDTSGQKPDNAEGWEQLPGGSWAANISRHPDTDESPRLSLDGKVLTFLSERGSPEDEMDVWMVYLDRDLEGKAAYEIDEYFKKAAEAAGKRKPLGAEDEKSKDKPKRDKGQGDKSKDGEPKNHDAEKAKPETVSPNSDDAKDEKTDADETKKPEKPKPLKFDVADAYLRIRRFASNPGNEGNLAMTPGGDRVIFSTSVEDERTLVSVDHKGKDRKTIQAGEVRDVRVSLTGDKVSFVRGGQASLAPKVGGKVEAMPIDAPIVIDVAQQQAQKFDEAAHLLGQRFYHPNLKGLDWTQLSDRYRSLATATRTANAFNRVLNMLFGELDGSHLGIWGGDRFSAPGVNTGCLGVRTKPVAGGYEILAVTRSAPADQPVSKLNIGDVIVAVNGAKLAPDAASLPTIDLDAAMAGTAGRETLIDVWLKADPTKQADEANAAEDAARPTEPRPVLITPVSYGAWSRLAYVDEVLRRRTEVDRLSSGRLGYLHIRGMSEESVREFERDLFAAGNGKEGLIIDVRDNGGGYTADILLSSLTAPRHAYTATRGVDPTTVARDVYPRDRRLIYAWTRPISVLINQNSFSNAEIFAHAIKTTGRGKLVGTRTFGGVISTGAHTLIDGTTVRTPFRGWYLPDGSDMENNGAKPDIEVPQTPEDEIAGRDRQLEGAVKELLERLDQQKR